MESLACLYLGGCTSLEYLPDELNGIAALGVLDAGGSGLRALPPAVTSLSALETLGLCGCFQLAALPDMLDGLSALRVLSVSR